MAAELLGKLKERGFLHREDISPNSDGTKLVTLFLPFLEKLIRRQEVTLHVFPPCHCMERSKSQVTKGLCAHADLASQ